MTEVAGKGTGNRARDAASRAHVWFYFISVSIFLLIDFLFLAIHINYATWRKMGGAMAKTGPNDASCVVWAFGGKFSIFSFMFSITNYCI